MAENNVDFQKDLDALKTDLAQLRTDMGSMVHTIKEISNERAGSVRDHAREELDRRIEQLTRTYEAVERHGRESMASVHHTLEERPVTAVAVAFGAGLILGKIISGKR